MTEPESTPPSRRPVVAGEHSSPGSSLAGFAAFLAACGTPGTDLASRPPVATAGPPARRSAGDTVARHGGRPPRPAAAS